MRNKINFIRYIKEKLDRLSNLIPRYELRWDEDSLDAYFCPYKKYPKTHNSKGETDHERSSEDSHKAHENRD